MRYRRPNAATGAGNYRSMSPNEVHDCFELERAQPRWIIASVKVSIVPFLVESAGQDFETTFRFNSALRAFCPRL